MANLNHVKATLLEPLLQNISDSDFLTNNPREGSSISLNSNGQTTVQPKTF